VYNILNGNQGEKKMTLLEKIQAMNAEKRAWVAEDPEHRGAGMLYEDLEHWATHGVTTAEELDRFLLETDLWEAYKQAYGVRPRHMDMASMTIDELQGHITACDEWSRMQQELDDDYAALETDIASKQAQLIEKMADTTPLTYNPFEGLLN